METLFFVASKLFWLVARPESWIVLLLVLGIWSLRRDRVGAAGKIFVSALFLVLLIGLLPDGKLQMRPLEKPYPATPDILAPTGIIILGGAEDARMSAATGWNRCGSSTSEPGLAVSCFPCCTNCRKPLALAWTPHWTRLRLPRRMARV
jgi:hypothetical protein